MALRPLDFVAPLFVPGNRPERFAKAAASGADAIVIDLEDAVAPPDKAGARAVLRVDFTDLPVIVRINGIDTPWHEADVEALGALQIAAVMLPKAATVEAVARLAARWPVIALVETAAGIGAARAIAKSGSAARMAFGSVDFAADIGCDHVREALHNARSELVLASRLGMLPPPLDGVTTDLSDPATAESDARYARALGFGGKLAIHPLQIGPIRAGFLPRSTEVEWAQKVLSSGDGVAMVDGMMVDEPVRARAHSILLRADLS